MPTVDLKPNAAGDETQIPTAIPNVAHYLNMDDPPGSPDDAATHVRTKYVGPGDPPEPKQS